MKKIAWRGAGYTYLVSELFCYTISPVVERTDRITFRKHVTNQALGSQKPLCCCRWNREDLVLDCVLRWPEIQIVRNLLFIIRVDIEILSLSLELRRIFWWSRCFVEALIVPGVKPDLPAAIIQFCLHEINPWYWRDHFPRWSRRRFWVWSFLSKVRVLLAGQVYPASSMGTGCSYTFLFLYELVCKLLIFVSLITGTPTFLQEKKSLIGIGKKNDGRRRISGLPIARKK